MDPVLVIGPGAIGVWAATQLAANGTPVVVAARNAASAAHLPKTFTTTDPRDRATAADVRVVGRPADLDGPVAAAVLATKCQDAVGALRAWRDAIGDAPVLGCQNGLMAPHLLPHVEGTYIDTCVTFPATLEGPGRAVRTGPGGFVVGPWPRAGPRDDPAPFRAAAAWLAAAGPVKAHPDMEGVRWTKLLINSAISSLGVMTGQDLGDWLGTRAGRRACLAVLREGYAVGRAAGVRFAPVQGLRPALFAGPENVWRHGILRLLAARHGRHRSSSLQSLRRGRKTEVDYLNGAIVAAARAHDAQAPVHAAVVEMVHAIEAGRVEPSPDLLRELPA